MRLIVDAHQDLAWNMLTFGRNYALSAAETRRHESGSLTAEHNGDTLLGWPEYQAGRVALIFSTLFAAPRRASGGDWDTQTYLNPGQAYSLYSNQLDSYLRLVDDNPDKFRLVHTTHDLEDVLAGWVKPEGKQTSRPVGLIPLMEGAEGVRTPKELEEWWQRGVRILGPAWRGNQYCGGTAEPGPLTDAGRTLLAVMADLGMTLDLSHMDWQAARESLDSYEGYLIASHANALNLLRGSESNRHLPDDLIDGIIERGGIIGVVPYNRFLLFGWAKTDSREKVSLDRVAAQVDYICQRAGDALHVGLGSDFDGGFGLQQTPFELDSIADLHKLAPFLLNRGYNNEDIDAIFGGNWINHLRKSLPS